MFFYPPSAYIKESLRADNVGMQNGILDIGELNEYEIMNHESVFFSTWFRGKII